MAGVQQDHDLSMIRHVLDYKYGYYYTWMGRPIIQQPQDIVALQEVIMEVQPDLINAPSRRPTQLGLNPGAIQPQDLILVGTHIAHMLPADAISPAAAEQVSVGTYHTNVMGTVHILECVRETDYVRSVLNVTTDKVYQNFQWSWGYRETDALNGGDPYSNSKSCSESPACPDKRPGHLFPKLPGCFFVLP